MIGPPIAEIPNQPVAEIASSIHMKAESGCWVKERPRGSTGAVSRTEASRGAAGGSPVSEVANRDRGIAYQVKREGDRKTAVNERGPGQSNREVDVWGTIAGDHYRAETVWEGKICMTSSRHSQAYGGQRERRQKSRAHTGHII